MNDYKASLRELPKIDALLADERITAYKGRVADTRLLETVRRGVEAVRGEVLAGKPAYGREALTGLVLEHVLAELDVFLSHRLQPVINATGVVIHTNLGRSPMSRKALEGLTDLLAGYSSLEYSVLQGKRRSRAYYAEELVKDITGAEAAAFVNNNAAAVVMVLNTLCLGKTALLSRGEIVEIGDSFRILEIINSSGATVREVGSTNRTRLSDYERHANANTGVILKVHTSNFTITGFTESVSTAELSSLGRERQIPVVEDMGSGVLTDLTAFGLPYERQVSDALKDGADLVTFSGDKLLGGPQAGVIAGRKDLVDKIRANQLFRCVRLDKARLYMMEKTLSAYFTGIPDVPALSLIKEDRHAKAKKLFDILTESPCEYDFKLTESQAEIGGGAVPGTVIGSWAVLVTSPKRSAAEIECMLRNAPVPVIAGVRKDKVCLDVIAMNQSDFPYIKEIFHG